MTIYLSTPEQLLAWEPSDQATNFVVYYRYSGFGGIPLKVQGDVNRIKTLFQKLAQPERFNRIEYGWNEGHVQIFEFDKDGDPI